MVGSSTGEFESGFEAGGQTREHALLVRSLGVTQLIVAVNKLDNVSDSYFLFVLFLDSYYGSGIQSDRKWQCVSTLLRRCSFGSSRKRGG